MRALLVGSPRLASRLGSKEHLQAGRGAGGLCPAAEPRTALNLTAGKQQQLGELVPPPQAGARRRGQMELDGELSKEKRGPA